MDRGEMGAVEGRARVGDDPMGVTETGSQSDALSYSSAGEGWRSVRSTPGRGLYSVSSSRTHTGLLSRAPPPRPRSKELLSRRGGGTRLIAAPGAVRLRPNPALLSSSAPTALPGPALGPPRLAVLPQRGLSSPRPSPITALDSYALAPFGARPNTGLSRGESTCTNTGLSGRAGR